MAACGLSSAQVASTFENAVLIWNMDDGKVHRTLRMNEDVVAFAHLSDGERLVVFTQASAVIWNIREGLPRQSSGGSVAAGWRSIGVRSKGRSDMAPKGGPPAFFVSSGLF